MKIEGKTFIISTSSRRNASICSFLTDLLAFLPLAGGLGAIGGATAREIIKEGGYVSVFDILPVEKGSELVKVSPLRRRDHGGEGKGEEGGQLRPRTSTVDPLRTQL